MPEKKSVKTDKTETSTTVVEKASAKTSEVKKTLTEEKKVALKPVKDTKITKLTEEIIESEDIVANEVLTPEQSKASVESSDTDKKTPAKKVKLSSTTAKTTSTKVSLKSDSTPSTAEPKPARATRASKNLSPEGNKIYSATASREYFKKGEIVLFEKVHNWLKHGEEVSAYGKIIDILVLDEDIPYIEVNFNDSDAKKLNKSSEGKSADLGNEIRRFLLEHTN